MKKLILIQVAMESELEFLIKSLKNKKQIKSKISTFYEGTIFGNPIVIVLSKIGIINSTVSLTEAILKYNPQIILNEGIAGAHSKNIHVNDIIIGTETINIMSAITPNAEESISTNWELVTFKKGKDELEIQKANNELVEISKKLESKYEAGNVYYGRIGSGDVWNREKEKIEYLNKKYQTLCEDMESIAIYKLANQFNIPVLSIKTISNNELTNEKYTTESSINSQKYLLNLIEEIIRKDYN